MTMTECLTHEQLVRLTGWLSPTFPVGAYSYSSGVERAIDAGLIDDAESLATWLEGLLRYGAGPLDGGVFLLAHAAVSNRDDDRLEALIEWADALRPSAELALESAEQGQAFLITLNRVWPTGPTRQLASRCQTARRKPAYSLAVGAACAAHTMPVRPCLSVFLHAVSANLVSAAIRCALIGQTDGQRIIARLEPIISELTRALDPKSPADLTSITLMADWTSMTHETQYSRLFRS